MKRYFILGTDTGCGKTYVTSALLQAFKKNNHRIHALKPVASGRVKHDGRWINEDIAQLSYHTAYKDLPLNAFSFQVPLSPHLAAHRENCSISVAAVADFCLQPCFSALDYLLIEGAGGLLVPLNAKETWLDFLKLSHIPVILVVGMRLGCLNHALLTATVLKSHGIACHGWIANRLDCSFLAFDDNKATLDHHLAMPWLGTVGYRGVSVFSPRFLF